MKKYQLTFEFHSTEEQAAAACERLNKTATPYMRKHHPAHYTPWESLDGRESKFIVWFHC